MSNILHTIPAGGAEPIHAASLRCWCQPLLEEPGVCIHHAKDLREARERHGNGRAGEVWIIVEQLRS